MKYIGKESRQQAPPRFHSLLLLPDIRATLPPVPIQQKVDTLLHHWITQPPRIKVSRNVDNLSLSRFQTLIHTAEHLCLPNDDGWPMLMANRILKAISAKMQNPNKDPAY